MTRLFEVTTQTAPGKSVVSGRQFRDYFEAKSLDEALEQCRRLYACNCSGPGIEYHSVVEVDAETLAPLVPRTCSIMEL